MLTVTSCKLELRGVANKESKNGKVYHVINCEYEDGTPYAFYCPNVSAIPAGLKKGDMVVIVFSVEYFKNNERLVVAEIKKA